MKMVNSILTKFCILIQLNICIEIYINFLITIIMYCPLSVLNLFTWTLVIGTP